MRQLFTLLRSDPKVLCTPSYVEKSNLDCSIPPAPWQALHLWLTMACTSFAQLGGGDGQLGGKSWGQPASPPVSSASSGAESGFDPAPDSLSESIFGGQPEEVGIAGSPCEHASVVESAALAPRRTKRS